MPAAAPPLADAVAAKLAAIGRLIRAHRKRLGVNGTTTAEAAGMSRVTLYRIERGEPSVTMGAYIGALDALGLELDVVDPRAHAAQPAKVG
jgi:transcriptional regulator with XRE-family HTH domain